VPKDTFFNLAEEKQEKIMRSAVSEFLNHGFEKGNVGDIAKNAGVSKGSMYQYFENKKEIFLFCVRWATELILKKYDKYTIAKEKNINIFDFFYISSKEMWVQLREERELIIFIQDVFLGKYSLKDESMGYIMKISDEYMLKLIQNGKNNGYIRKDIDDNLLSIFMTGASIKYKEYIMNKARDAGEDIIDENYEVWENEIKALVELLKNGMGQK
jgi:AcrR family transcriptional regulator